MGQLAFAPLGDTLTAKTSPHASLLLSTTLLGLATFGFGMATTFRQLLVARAAQGAASAAVLSGGLSLLAETHSPHTRGTAIGRAYSGLATGLLCGPLVGGLMFNKFGRKRTFRLAALVVSLNALAQAILMSVAPSVTKYRNDTNTKKSDLLASSRALLCSSQVLLVAASTFAIHTVVGVIKPLSQVVLDREFGLGMVHRSWTITIATLTYFVTTPLAGRWSDRMSRSTLLAAILLCMALSAAFFALRPVFGPAALHVCIGLLGASLGLHGAAGQSLLADLVDQFSLGDYSMAFALSDMADSLGAIAGPIVGLSLCQAMDSRSEGPGLMGLLCLILAPLVYRIHSQS
jgi:MFS transporter, DHA1 family, solute carrier family 18 (vesicular amine transporter), member 1/2